ncbi:hypothetical protein AX766_03240 [Flavobacterium covae]|nr:hypothetical protein AWN65_02130 [Flavobacterium covae]AND63489.1 hypothetical protein AX766_03240 [Flavobacterium covae]OXA78706.1 hypothetical protein B0A56_08320 [Flavobacterium columnare NBRC 100251 = ATCC 23463]
MISIEILLKKRAYFITNKVFIRKKILRNTFLTISQLSKKVDFNLFCIYFFKTVFLIFPFQNNLLNHAHSFPTRNFTFFNTITKIKFYRELLRHHLEQFLKRKPLRKVYLNSEISIIFFYKPYINKVKLVKYNITYDK